MVEQATCFASPHQARRFTLGLGRPEDADGAVSHFSTLAMEARLGLQRLGFGGRAVGRHPEAVLPQEGLHGGHLHADSWKSDCQTPQLSLAKIVTTPWAPSRSLTAAAPASIRRREPGLDGASGR
jgi:hypothetical protein